jgi:hypothetical protein
MTVIGLTGIAGSGKSTVAKYLVEEHGYTLLSFAAPLKKMMRTLNPYIAPSPVAGLEDGNDPTRPNPNDEPLRLGDLLSVMTEAEIKTSSAGKEYRRLLQTLGTDCVRAVDPEFWVHAAAAQMTDSKGKYVFDDVRFPNEAAMIRRVSPTGLWNVQRPSQEIVGGDHISEKHAGYMNESVWIVNDELDRLYSQVDVYLKYLTGDESSAERSDRRISTSN